MPTVISINQQRGMAVIEIESNICAVVEILSTGELNVGDPVTGEFESEGASRMFNQNSFDQFDIIVQNANIGRDYAISRANLK